MRDPDTREACFHLQAFSAPYSWKDKKEGRKLERAQVSVAGMQVMFNGNWTIATSVRLFSPEAKILSPWENDIEHSSKILSRDTLFRGYPDYGGAAEAKANTPRPRLLV